MHNRECGEVDVSIVATYMMLKLFDLGLGSTYVGSFDYKDFNSSVRSGSQAFQLFNYQNNPQKI